MWPDAEGEHLHEAHLRKWWSHPWPSCGPDWPNWRSSCKIVNTTVVIEHGPVAPNKVGPTEFSLLVAWFCPNSGGPPSEFGIKASAKWHGCRLLCPWEQRHQSPSAGVTFLIYCLHVERVCLWDERSLADARSDRSPGPSVSPSKAQ